MASNHPAMDNNPETAATTLASLTSSLARFKLYRTIANFQVRVVENDPIVRIIQEGAKAIMALCITVDSQPAATITAISNATTAIPA